MSQCIDKHTGDKLFAYELNLLSPEDDQLVELHLLECEHCRERAKRMAGALEQIRENPAARDIIDQIDSEQVAPVSPAVEKRRWYASWRPVALAAAAIVILLLRPWEFHLHTTQEAVADEPRVAVMYFDNLSDQADSLRLGDIATDLLITGLSQSKHVQVVSTQRLYDILKLLGREGQKRIDRTIATQVAQKSNAKWMLLGSILETKPHFIVTAQVVEVATGQVVSGARIQGRDGENLFALADSLTAKISGDLSWPLGREFELSGRSANNKTNSLDAYRYYVEGLEAFYRYDLLLTPKLFRKAVELDSTFAMAYYWIASYQWLWVSYADTLAMGKAARYAEKASQREQCYIRSMQALIVADYPRGIAVLKNLVARYPDEKDAYQLLGICYGRLHQLQASTDYYFKALELDSLFADIYASLMFNLLNLGDYQKSIWASEKYISLRPKESAPYGFRGDIEAIHGDIDRAIDWYRKANELEPNSFIENLGHAYLLKEQYASADSCYHIMASNADRKAMRSGGRVCLALVPLYQGKFRDALQILNDGIAADKMERFSQRAFKNKVIFKAMICEQQGHIDSALSLIEQIKTNYRKNYHFLEKFYGLPNYARLLALSGRIGEAEKVAEELKAQMGGNEAVICDYWWAVGNIEMAKGNWERAITDFETALQHSDSEFTFRVSLSYAQLQAGKPADAIIDLEKALENKHWWRIAMPIEAVRAHYYLALAYEQTGQNDKARREYEEFLDIWKSADPGIAEVIDARSRLTRLKMNI